MKLKIFPICLLSLVLACADNELDVQPTDQSFPLRIVLDTDEGADLPDAEDYDIEVKFADYIGELPSSPLTLAYSFTDIEDDMDGVVTIDKITYEVEIDNCTFERELEFAPSADGLSGIITIAVDEDLGTVPESFEIVVVLPGEDDTEGSFALELADLTTSENVILGTPEKFEYEVFNGELGGEWELEIESEEEFDLFKQVFAPLLPELESLSFFDITGKVSVEFEAIEMNMVIELAEEEEVTTCEDGETETEIENKVLELEAEYEAEDGEIVFEGSHFILGDDGEIEDELDYQVIATYTLSDDDQVSFSFFKVIDEDSFADGEELFRNNDGIVFNLNKD